MEYYDTNNYVLNEDFSINFINRYEDDEDEDSEEYFQMYEDEDNYYKSRDLFLKKIIERIADEVSQENLNSDEDEIEDYFSDSGYDTSSEYDF